MLTFIVLQKIVLFRVNWITLYNPAHYRLELIVHAPTYEKLEEAQKTCFEKIHCLNEFNKETIQETIKHIIYNAPGEIKIITNDELCILLAAELREAFNLAGDHLSNLTRFINKLEMKQLLLNTDIPLPKYYHFDSVACSKDPEKYIHTLQQTLGLPIFVKPIDSAASQNTAKLHSTEEIYSWCQNHTNKDNFEFDEFITGTLYHCDSIVRNNQILLTKIGQNVHPCFEFASGKIAGTITLSNDNPIVDCILDFNQKILKAFQPLPNCVTHLEIFERQNGELVFLEIACRAPGGMIVQMYEKNCGINFEQAHFAMQMDLPFNIPDINGPYCAWAWFPMQAGKINDYVKLTINSPHQLTWKVKIDERYDQAKSLIDYAGSIILWNDDAEILTNDFNYLSKLEGVLMTALG